MLKIPPTRNHLQLASWINAHDFVDVRGEPIVAQIARVVTSTDTKIGRLRWPGKGRRGFQLRIWTLKALKAFYRGARTAPLFEHTSSETYRRHEEARKWVSENLRRPR